jgi:toxin ParE1/3/4
MYTTMHGKWLRWRKDYRRSKVGKAFRIRPQKNAWLPALATPELPIVWSPQAVGDAEQALAYIAARNPAAAARLHAALINSIENLANYPALGRAGRVASTRELVVPNTPFVVPYRVHTETLEIIRVFHSAQRWPDAL